MFKFEDHLTEKQKRDIEWRKERVAEIKSEDTVTLMGTIIHTLHNSGRVWGGARIEGAATLVQNEFTCYDPVYDSQLRYTYTPEMVVRMWCQSYALGLLLEKLESYEAEEIVTKDARGHHLNHEKNGRMMFPEKCPVCQHDIRAIFMEFVEYP